MLASIANVFAATAEPGRLQIPASPLPQSASLGLQKLGGRNGVLYIPSNYRPSEPLPLLVLLHRARGSSAEWFRGSGKGAHGPYAAHADDGGFIILAPEAPGQTWGAGPKTWGHDFVSINQALEAASARCAIDRNRLAIGGFSDGASYALSLGLANGDLFGDVIAFSPGFFVGGKARGKPSPQIFVSHGIGDRVLPIDVSSRAFVPGLRKNGYKIDFQEFSGGHDLPPAIRDQAMAWLKRNWKVEGRK